MSRQHVIDRQYPRLNKAKFCGVLENVTRTARWPPRWHLMGTTDMQLRYALKKLALAAKYMRKTQLNGDGKLTTTDVR